MGETNNNSATSSPTESGSQGGNVYNANVRPGSPLSDVSHDNGKSFIPLHKYTKKNALCESMSGCDHLPSPPSSTVSEQSKFKRKIRVDLGLGLEKENKSSKSSFCSSFHDSDSNISTTKTLLATKEFKSHRESHQQGQFLMKDNAASTNFDICFHGKRKSALTGATPHLKNKENCVEFEMQEGGTNGGILRPGMVLLKHHLTHDEQDRDESRESLQKGLPVVSFSIGDSAEFLYSDQRNVEKAENVLLESGDVLIFGGESRHVYHGVSSIIQNSAPEVLVRDTCLCPGRLNLTFRQY